MKRILVFGMTENPGGVEAFLINYYRKINREMIQFDFLCNTYDKVAYEDELLSLGGRTFHITARSKNRKLYKRELESVFKSYAKDWCAIWVNVCSLANIDYLYMAKKYGIQKRIIHSHNSQNMDSFARGLLHKLNKLRIKNIATDFWACSDEAADWFYSGKARSKTEIVHNAIDVNNMMFDTHKREKLRAQYGLQGKYVIGNVGRLHFQKNQKFGIEVFSEYLKIDPKVVLVFIGAGQDENMLKEKTATLGIKDNVLFMGLQKDIQGWLSSFDLFLFPSLFEGLSIAALEAQANGVPVLASDNVIPKELKMNDNFNFFDLSEDKKAWAQKIVEIKKNNIRKEYAEILTTFKQNHYEIGEEVGRLETLLLN